MHSTTLFAFTLTNLVVAPALLTRLEAGAPQLGRLVAPSSHTLSIDGVRIDASIDRSLVDAGQSVTITLYATSPTKKRVALSILEFESVGNRGGRVDDPPNEIASKRVVVEGTPDGATQTVSFVVRGHRPREPGGGQRTLGHYTFFVLPPAAATELRRLRKEYVEDPMNENPGYTFSSVYRLDGGPFSVDTVARLEVSTHTPDSAVSIVAPDVARVGEPFAVTVRVANRSDKPKITRIMLGAVSSQLAGKYIGAPAGEADLEISERSYDEIEIAPQQTREETFQVTAKRTGTLGLAGEGQCWMECSDGGGISDGQLATVEIVAAQPTVSAR